MLRLSILLISIVGFLSVCSAEISRPLFPGIQLRKDKDQDLIKHNPVPKQELVTQQVVRALVWNIYKQNRDRLVADLQSFSMDHDIMILQEIHLTKSFEKSLEGPTLSRHHFVTAPSFNYQGFPTGVATSTRFPYLGALPLKSPVTEPVLFTPKMSLYLTIPVQGSRPLMVANVHGINFVGQNKFGRHMKQVFDTLKKHDGPIVLAGDFNTRNKKRMNLVQRLAQEIDLELVELDNDRRRNPLDLIFSRGLTIIGAELRNDIQSSDHPPLQLIFSIPRSLTP